MVRLLYPFEQILGVTVHFESVRSRAILFASFFGMLRQWKEESNVEAGRSAGRVQWGVRVLP